MKRNCFEIIKYRYITEKAKRLEQLKDMVSNPCLKKCETPKYLFMVDKRANKQEIAKAIEEIYRERNVKVIAVNTIRIKPKPRRVRGRLGKKAGYKKAVVSLEKGDSLDNV